MGMGLSPIYLNKGTDSRLGLTKKDSDLLEIVHLSFDFISFHYAYTDTEVRCGKAF